MVENPDRLSQLRASAEAKDLERFEEIWMETIASGDVPPDLIDGLIESAEPLLKDPSTPSSVATLLELLCSCVSEETPPKVVLRLYQNLLAHFSDNRQYREAFSEAFENVHPLSAPERAIYEVVGLAGAANVGESLRRLEFLLQYREGAYVFHNSGWGMGKVLSVDPFLRQVCVDLEEKPNHRVAIDAVDSILQYLESDSFQAMAFDREEELHRLRDEEPVALVTKVVESFGNPLNLKELRGHLVPTVLDTKSWSRWWSKTKKQLRDSGYFRVTDRAPHTIEKLETAVSYADEMLNNYFASEWRQARRIAKQATRRAKTDLKETWEKIAAHLIELINGSDSVKAIDAATIIDRTAAGESEQFLQRVLSNLDDGELKDALGKLPGPEAQRRAIAALVEAKPDSWLTITEDLAKGPNDVVRRAALATMESHAADRLTELIEEMLKAPRLVPEATCFLLQAYAAGDDRPALVPLRSRSPREILVMLFDLVDHLVHWSGRRSGYKETGVKLQGVLGDGDRAVFKDGIAQMGDGELRRLHERIVGQESFPTELKGILLDILSEQQPALVAQDKEVPPWEEECIYTTEAGLEKREGEFREIADVKIPKNIKDIGRAREFGDLSENAEYTAALETRDQLTAQLTRIKGELDIAKIIDRNVGTEQVGLGTHLRVVDLGTGEEKAYNMLGPWDGSPEEGTLNYRSPLARALFGMKAGEITEVELPGGTLSLKIEEIRSCFD